MATLIVLIKEFLLLLFWKGCCLATSCSMWEISSPTRIEPVPLAAEAQSINHWTAGEVSDQRGLNESVISLSQRGSKLQCEMLWICSSLSQWPAAFKLMANTSAYILKVKRHGASFQPSSNEYAVWIRNNSLFKISHQVWRALWITAG